LNGTGCMDERRAHKSQILRVNSNCARVVGYSEVGQKRISRKTAVDLPEADFGTTSYESDAKRNFRIAHHPYRSKRQALRAAE
jgi:hypothetical protein